MNKRKKKRSNNIKTIILTYLAMLLCLLCMDGIWLGLIATDSYQQAMGHIMRDSPLVWPWIAFYLFYPWSILILAVNTQQPNHTGFKFVLRGFILGATAYGVYNLTNFSLLADWPWLITIKDWIWGSFLTASVAWVGGYVWTRYSLEYNKIG